MYIRKGNGYGTVSIAWSEWHHCDGREKWWREYLNNTERTLMGQEETHRE